MRQVLVLNSSYEVLSVIDWQAAVTGLCSDKLVLVEEYDEVIRSASTEMRLPAVVKTVKYVTKPVKNLKFSRANVYARDGYKCMYCGDKCASDELTYDHVMPRSKGGKTEWTNIVTCCYLCNRQKGGRTPREASMSLLAEPKQPNWVPAVAIRISLRSVPDAWTDYLYWTGELDSGDT